MTVDAQVVSDTPFLNLESNGNSGGTVLSGGTETPFLGVHSRSGGGLPYEVVLLAGGAAPTAATYHMAVWNTTISAWVRWTKIGSPDPSGASYPGPGTFGVDTQTPAIVEFVEQ